MHFPDHSLTHSSSSSSYQRQKEKSDYCLQFCITSPPEDMSDKHTLVRRRQAGGDTSSDSLIS